LAKLTPARGPVSTPPRFSILCVIIEDMPALHSAARCPNCEHLKHLIGFLSEIAVGLICFQPESPVEVLNLHYMEGSSDNYGVF